MASRSGRLQLETALIPDESRIQPVICAANDMLLARNSAGAELVSRLQRKLGISAAEARKRVTAYKQFLALKAASLDIDATKLSPPPLIDRVWHEHVLDTKRYAPACLTAFGHPIHHDPNGDADVEAALQLLGSVRRALLADRGRAFCDHPREARAGKEVHREEDGGEDLGPE
mgnify:CR=1 FL=1